jgi:hypothetical protein
VRRTDRTVKWRGQSPDPSDSYGAVYYDMNADDLIQELAVQIYQAPLSSVRFENDYPDLGNPLHLAVLLIDCDTEIEVNGMLGFLENMTGRYLPKTIEALTIIDARTTAAILQSVQACMAKYGVSWERLRADFEGASEFQVTSFREMHGEELDSFVTEVGELAQGFSIFNPRYSAEDAYGALCRHLDARLGELRQEIDKRRIQ